MLAIIYFRGEAQHYVSMMNWAWVQQTRELIVKFKFVNKYFAHFAKYCTHQIFCFYGISIQTLLHNA